MGRCLVHHVHQALIARPQLLDPQNVSLVPTAPDWQYLAVLVQPVMCALEGRLMQLVRIINVTPAITVMVPPCFLVLWTHTMTVLWAPRRVHAMRVQLAIIVQLRLVRSQTPIYASKVTIVLVALA